MVKLEFQYFHGCPNSAELLRRVREAAHKFSGEVELEEVLVETPGKAMEVFFRGSPTLLINGEDFERLPAPSVAGLTCRNYSKGLPEVEAIAARIKGSL